MIGTKAPATPLIVKSDDGVILFRSVEVARAYLEVPDVEAGVYGPAYDAEGRLLSIELPAQLFEAQPEGLWRRLRWRVFPSFNPVEVLLEEGEPTHQAELIDLLSNALDETPRESGDIRQMLALGVQRFGIT